MSLDRPGFTDPVLQSQAAFRAVLEALSRPGRRQSLGADLHPPARLSQAAAAVLLTLVDGDTVLHLADDTQDAAPWLQFHAGTQLGSLEHADFVLARTLPDLGLLAQGTDDAPELSATVILEVSGFDEGSRYVLAGPGLQSPSPVTISGLPEDFLSRWQRNHALYPTGVDLILCHGTEIMAFPRSLTVMEA